MSHPFRTALIAGALALITTGCATFTNTAVVAEVDDAEISDDRFEEMSAIYFERGDAFGTEPPVQGAVNAEASRFLLSALVNQQLFRSFLAEQGVDATEDREFYRNEVIPASQLGELGLDDEFLALITDINEEVRARSFARVQTPNVDELRTAYERDPDSVGVACVRHILVATRDEAEAIVDDLDAGAAFEELAEAQSTDPSAVGQGGAIRDPQSDNECILLETVVRGFDPGFAQGVLDASVGVPTEPIESSFGWHVILHRPWDEVADSVTALHQPGASGKLLFDGFAATADIEVDPRYGTWNRLASAVQPIG
ncbi:MAG: hypothetical protein HKN41_09470 [Ilumatobacter sp.]|nr:hypothetical protein [Ilumatobacter sp.]